MAIGLTDCDPGGYFEVLSDLSTFGYFLYAFSSLDLSSRFPLHTSYQSTITVAIFSEAAYLIDAAKAGLTSCTPL
jgi:hypothetical protein